MSPIRKMEVGNYQPDYVDHGRLQLGVYDTTIGKPLQDVAVRVRRLGEEKVLEELITNDSGQTATIVLDTPPIEYTQQPGENKPFADYSLEVDNPDYEPLLIQGIDLYSDSTAYQQIMLTPRTQLMRQEGVIVVKQNTLWATYPPKIPEEEVKPLGPETGFVVLDKPVIPEFIVVHDGLPDNTAAQNYYVKFADYVKNVASCEIYPTWPRNTIIANVLAIISFTLNRVFTEWYRAKGKNFTITSTTAFDHAFSYGRNIFQEISSVVDEIFTTYITRPNIKQPLLAQYCDGVKTTCQWMSQWGSKALGDQGVNYTDILKRYYGSDIFLMQAEKVTGIPSSYPGKPLQMGSTGKDVRTIQEQLNAISNNYPAIKKVKVDGVFGDETRLAVETFQDIFKLNTDGIVGFSTWYKISDVYVAVAKLA